MKNKIKEDLDPNKPLDTETLVKIARAILPKDLKFTDENIIKWGLITAIKDYEYKQSRIPALIKRRHRYGTGLKGGNVVLRIMRRMTGLWTSRDLRIRDHRTIYDPKIFPEKNKQFFNEAGLWAEMIKRGSHKFTNTLDHIFVVEDLLKELRYKSLVKIKAKFNIKDCD